MAHVEADTCFSRAERSATNRPTIVDESLTGAGEGVSHDVARSQQRKHTLQRGRTIADVAHDRQTGDLGRLDRLAERPQSRVADSVLARAHFDADDQVTVGLD